jgi:hypothetical protein
MNDVDFSTCLGALLFERDMWNWGGSVVVGCLHSHY